MFNLLACTKIMLEAKSHEDMKQAGQKIASDPILLDHHRAILRLIFGARWAQIGEGVDPVDAGETQSALAWMFDLLSCTQLMLEARNHEDMKRVGQKIASDPILQDHHRAILRLIFGARWAQIGEAQTDEA